MSKITVDNCHKCPFYTQERDMQATLNVCNHPESPDGYGSVMDRRELDSGADWCPLKKGSIQIAFKGVDDDNSSN